ncbi:DNA-packaging protein, partial [Candidatus Pacearchaeota archaeon]|nr:DNA-packaging protein [Candidatus Pacearchaeota archaeon]
SFSDSLALLNSSKARDILKSQAYQSMWPRQTKDDSDSKKMWWLQEGGGVYATSTFGQVTGHRAGLMEDGFTGALIIDDPIKPADANSDLMRNGVNENYQETIASRLAIESVPIIIIMQRIHYSDLSGYLLRGGSGENWHHLNLPVIIDNKKAYPKENTHGIPIEHGLSDGWLWTDKHSEEHRKALMSHKRKWRAQYMQDPARFEEEGALWTEEMVTQARHNTPKGVKVRTIVAVDPAVSNNPDSDLHGIVVASHYKREKDDNYSVDADYSLQASPATWAQVVINAYDRHDADAVIVETNQGGDLVEENLRLNGYKGRVIRVHAAKGKFARAEPIAALYEQGLVCHNGDNLNELEDECMEYVPMTSKESPNRLDALVWGLTELSGLIKTALIW